MTPTIMDLRDLMVDTEVKQGVWDTIYFFVEKGFPNCTFRSPDIDISLIFA